MQRLTVTHVTQWQKHRHRIGEGHVSQGRFKSFPVEEDDYFYQLVRYVERNALRAGHNIQCGRRELADAELRRCRSPWHFKSTQNGPCPGCNGTVDADANERDVQFLEKARQWLRDRNLDFWHATWDKSQGNVGVWVIPPFSGTSDDEPRKTVESASTLVPPACD